MASLLLALSRAVRSRRVSAEELVREALRRIESAGDLNAVVALGADSAIDDARAIDALAARGAPVGDLAGIPTLIKDTTDVAGMRTTHGSLLHADGPPATRDGLATRRLRAAGAVVVGKTNTPEFAFQGFTDNRVFGATRNPWAPGWSPGGSSGGSGAALAAGLVPIATATDGGGSIRIPAALCGLAGLKPTNGVIGRDPIPEWIDLSTDGPLAATVTDLGVLLRVLAGPVIGDPTAQVSWRLRRRTMPARILATRTFDPELELSAAVEERFAAAMGLLAAVTGRPIEMIDALAAIPSRYRILDWFHNVGPEHLHYLGDDRVAREAERLDPPFARVMRAAARVTPAEYHRARRRRFDYARDLDELLGEDGVIVTPTLTVEGWSPDGALPGGSPGTLPDAAFNTDLANLTGHPALALPAGRHASGLPFGIQVVGPRYREDLLFGIGERLQAAAPWPLAADGYRPFSLDTFATSRRR
jgi:Asp-tRNA(Asn)/Glu-tRNA(Gln) amidotransferase A subunit family amidase